MEEPAYDVFRLSLENLSTEEIVQYCEKKYGDSEANIVNFVHQISDSLNTLNEVKIKIDQDIEDKIEFKSSFYKVECYKFADRCLSISYGDSFMYEQFHHLLKHLVVDKPDVFIAITIWEKDDWLFFIDSKNKTINFSIDELEFFKGAVLKYLCAFIYEKDPDSFMMTIHASGIIKNNETIVFVASEGSGKSTIAALLKAKGYSHLSDDIVAVDKNLKAFPFPAGISVKEGSVKTLLPYFPEIMGQKENRSSHKPARFIPNHNLEPYFAQGCKIKAIVFVEFNAKRNYKFKSLDKKIAVQKYLKETWINPELDNVKLFFEWINETSFYELRYSEISQLTHNISQIFEG